MIGIVMAGGKGSRMNLPKEKLLLKYKKPTIIHVVEALEASKCFSKIMAVTSSNSPKTKKLLEEKHIEIYDTPGDNYVSDLNLVLKSLNDFVLITSGDLPLLDGDIIQKIVNLRHSDNMWTTILVTKEFLHSLNLSSDYEIKYENQICCYTGISLVNTKIINNFESILEKFFVINDKRIAFNLNTKQDYSLLNTT